MKQVLNCCGSYSTTYRASSTRLIRDTDWVDVKYQWLLDPQKSLLRGDDFALFLVQRTLLTKILNYKNRGLFMRAQLEYFYSNAKAR